MQYIGYKGKSNEHGNNEKSVYKELLMLMVPLVVYAILRQDELLKIPFMYKRYKSYRWVKNITK